MKEVTFFKWTFVCLNVLLLVACGGGGGGDDGTTTPGATTPVNVALATNGGLASASANDLESFYINDGDDATGFWAASSAGDYIDLTFDQVYTVSEFTLLMDATAGWSNTDMTFETSADGVLFGDEINLITDCYSASLGASQIYCELGATRDIRAIRVTIDAASHAATTFELYEFEVMGQ